MEVSALQCLRLLAKTITKSPAARDPGTASAMEMGVSRAAAVTEAQVTMGKTLSSCTLQSRGMAHANPMPDA
jgi:hypothetical protein